MESNNVKRGNKLKRILNKIWKGIIIFIAVCYTITAAYIIFTNQLGVFVISLVGGLLIIASQYFFLRLRFLFERPKYALIGLLISIILYIIASFGSFGLVAMFGDTNVLFTPEFE